MDTTPFDLIVIEPADESAGEPTDVPITAERPRRRSRRRSSLLVASVLSVAAVAIAVATMPADRRGGTPPTTAASDTLPAEEGANPDRSALLDGHAFEQAVAAAVAIADRDSSALLDGRAFERAVEDAVESAIG